MEIVSFKKNEALFRQGEIATNMYEIVTGQVGVYMDYGEESQKELGILGEGDFVGELELIDSSTRIASAVAIAPDTTAKKLTIEDFNSYMSKNPAKVVVIIQQLAGRMRRLDNYYLEACKTIDEYRRCEESRLPKSPSLLARLKRFSAVVRKRG
ncbi:MAG: cyclic nucleotide-binding domain-containing protein [Spirochaetales bacterium]|nr:cyclic nucleotide-binding domain-containing protein [Spirochaetales bacterium]